MSYLGPRSMSADNELDGWLTFGHYTEPDQIGASVSAVAGPGSRVYVDFDGGEFVYSVIEVRGEGAKLYVTAGAGTEFELDLRDELMAGAILTISPAGGAA